MFFLVLLFANARATQPVCSDLKSVYNTQNCCQGSSAVDLCGTGTQWDGQKCQVRAFNSTPMLVESYGHPGENLTVLSKIAQDGGWHTCTCKDGSTYQCQSKHGDGAACCDRSMPAICGEGNVDMGGYEFEVPFAGSAWHTCTCADGSTYQCQSNHGDGDACCDRSMPAICGEDNVPSNQSDTNGGGWHTCTCHDGSTYQCRSNRGDGAACCDRSMPTICGLPRNHGSLLDPDDTAVFDLDQRALTSIVTQNGGWHTCTCADGSTYQCQSKRGDGAACCTRSMPAICGDGNVPSNGGTWHTCTCADSSTFQCRSNHGDGAACCDRIMPAVCGQCQVSTCKDWDCDSWCKCFNSNTDYSVYGCSGDGDSCDCTDDKDSSDSANEDGGAEKYVSVGNLAALRQQLHGVEFSPCVWSSNDKYTCGTTAKAFPTPRLPCGQSGDNCGTTTQYTRPSRACCKAMTASCLACAAGETIEEYCLGHKDTQGCEASPLFYVDHEDAALVRDASTKVYGFDLRGIQFESEMHGLGAAPGATDGRRLRRDFTLGGIVKPVDDRKEVCSSSNPYGKVVRIIYENSGAVCTGTLVSPRHVLTAGHCLYNFKGLDDPETGWLNIKGIMFTPCKNADKMKTTDPPVPKSYSNSDIDRSWTWARTVKGWTRQGKWEYDYGMIELSEKTSRGWMSFGYDNSLPNYSYNLNGFPGASAPQGTGDYDNLVLGDGSKVYWTGFELAHDYDKTYDKTDKLIAYEIDTWGGQSGSGVYAYFKNKEKRVIYGVHRGWDGDSDQDDATYNVAKRITSHTFAQLCGWMNEPSVC